MKSQVLTLASHKTVGFRPALLQLALLAALWLGAPTARGAASLTATPSRIWLGESVQVTVGAIGWRDGITGETNAAPTASPSGCWVYPQIVTDDGQDFGNTSPTSTNIWTFSFFPSRTGTIAITAAGTTVTVDVVGLAGISYSPDPVPVGSNVTFTANLTPVDAALPSALEWSTNVIGSGVSAAQTWTNYGTYQVEVLSTNLYGVYATAFVPIYAAVEGWAVSPALCCGANGDTNTFYVLVLPQVASTDYMASVRSNLVSWTGGPLTGTVKGAPIDVCFTNPGPTIITATCGSSTVSLTNVLYRIEIEPLRKTNYFAYGGTNTVTLNLTNSYGAVDWYIDGLKTDNVTSNSITIFSDIPTGECAGAAEYTVTAISRDTGTCVDTATIFIVNAEYSPSPLVIPIGSTRQVWVTVTPDSVASLLVFTNSATNIAAVSGVAPLLDVIAATNAGIADITATINGVSLLSTGQVVVFTASFRTNVIAIPEGGAYAGEVEIKPTNSMEVAMSLLSYESSAPTNCTITGSGTNFTASGLFYGTNSIYLTVPTFTNRLDTGAVTVVRLTLESATLAGTKSHIQNDMTGLRYPEPNWMYGRATNYPCLALAGSPVLIDVKLRVLPVSYTNRVVVQADGASPILAKIMNPQAGSNYVIWNGAASSNAAGAVYYGFNVGHYSQSFNWQFTTPQCSNSFSPAGTSVNELYLALANVEKRHTIVHLACQDNGATDSGQAATNTWSKFPALNVTTWDLLPLYYYLGGVPLADRITTATNLIANQNGQCGAWVDLLIQAFAVNGAIGIKHQVTHTSTLGGTNSGKPFMVKNWTFGPQDSGPLPPWGTSWQITNQLIAFPAGGSTFFSTMCPLPSDGNYGQATFLMMGSGGQNEPQPAEAMFSFHFVVKYADKYLDPSYGRVYLNAADFKDQVIDGIIRVKELAEAGIPASGSIMTITRPDDTDSFTLP